MKWFFALLLLLPLSASSQTLQGSSPLNLANGLILPAPATITFPGSTTQAPGAPGVGNWAGSLGLFGNTGTLFATVNNSTMNLSTANIISWNNDTGITRHTTPGVLDIGNGTAQSTAGGVQTGNATLLSLTTGTNADFLCLNSGGGILIQTTACTISSLRFKPDWKPYQYDALAKISEMDVGTFHTNTGPNADPNAQSLQAGLNAENIAKIAPECAIYENDMKTPKSYRQECVIALLVKAIQQIGHAKAADTGQR